MSLKVSGRVWAQSHQRGTMKLLLLALAEFANDDGICWPAASTLAQRINETERNVRLLMKRLIEDGDVIALPGGGRGNTTRYGVVTGLTERQVQRLNSDLQNSVRSNSDIEKTVKSGAINSEILGMETVKSGDLDEGLNCTTESGATPQYQSDNRNRTVKEPGEGIDSTGENFPPAHPAIEIYISTTKVRPPKISAEMIASQVTDLPRWEKEIKRWLASGHKPNNVTGMLDWYHGKGRHQNGTQPERKPTELPLIRAGPSGKKVLTPDERRKIADEIRNERS